MARLTKEEKERKAQLDQESSEHLVREVIRLESFLRLRSRGLELAKKDYKEECESHAVALKELEELKSEVTWRRDQAEDMDRREGELGRRETEVSLSTERRLTDHLMEVQRLLAGRGDQSNKDEGP